MQASGRGTDQFGEAAFDVHVDVFERALELERAGVDLRQNRVQAVSDLFRIVRRNDALLGQHVGMGFGRGDVLAYKCRSKSMEVLISSMMASGPDANRPPHILLLIVSLLSPIWTS